MLELPDWVRSEMENLKQADQRHELRLDDHERRIERLQDDMRDIKTMLAKAATKDDINVVLRDALNSVPAKQTMLWSAALVAMTALTLFFHK
jgi:hypothetical protein